MFEGIESIILAFLIFIAALLYSSVGHAGASGYIAAMALLGVAPATMKPVALSLNVLVASIATIKFYRADAFSWNLFWPLAIASIPFAYLGGLLVLPSQIYKPLVGAVLIYAAWRSYHTANNPPNSSLCVVGLPIIMLAGACLGLLSGLTGVGGGIFLSPILLFFRWAEPKKISGIAAGFILVNSIAGLFGCFTSAVTIPRSLPFWAVAAVIGGYIGADFGSKRLGNPTIQKLLALVLFIAGVKMGTTG
jgi:hypothetical protein